jgi:opacity protein-like surface antigen
MTDSEMGNKTSKASVRQQEVELTISSTMNTIYTLKFTGFVTRWDDHKEVRSQHVRHARYDLENTHEWGEWLGATMRDALINECEKFTGKIVHMKSDPPVADIVLTLDPRIKKKHFYDESYKKINGTVQWRSVSTDSSAMRGAVDWRLGDRMSYYGLEDEKEKWAYIFSPGEITSAPHTG